MESRLIQLIRALLVLVVGIVVLEAGIVFFLLTPRGPEKAEAVKPLPAVSFPAAYWTPPDTNNILEEPDGQRIAYGRELIRRTAEYLGPQGKVARVSNGMNCQNCHLNAGTKIFGNNFSAVASTYPKVRNRSGTLETIPKRINDCVERSLNGVALREDSEEMKALVAYMNWVGKDVAKGESPVGVGLVEPVFLEEPADPVRGQALYSEKCARCHGPNGEGELGTASEGWKYPPLWGPRSFNQGAGLYRLSRMAGFIKANMPFETTSFAKPELTDEESWHIAAYLCSMPRPAGDLSKDWPNIATKPFDHPFGPFSDGFGEAQHKFGPFKPILARRTATE